MKRRQVFAVVVAVALGGLGSLAEAAKPAPKRAMVLVPFDTRFHVRGHPGLPEGASRQRP